MSPELSNECFFISPVGEDGSPERERADGILRAIVEPAAEAVGLSAVRADHMAEPGQITTQIIEHLIGAAATVADLTGGNPNVYYELGVRHAFRKPLALVAERGTRLPFDAYQMRTVFFDSTSLTSAAEARDLLADHLRRALDGAVDSPVATTLDIQSLRGGSDQEQGLAELLLRVDDFSHRLGDFGRRLEMVWREVRSISEDQGHTFFTRARETPVHDVPPLTEFETRILQLVAKGMNNRDIAKVLATTEDEIKAHIRPLLEKLGAHSRMEAVVYAIRNGIIEVEK